MHRRNNSQIAASTITLIINGKRISVPSGTSVAAALALSGDPARNSVSGEPRSPLCAMGICMECCATVNGTPHTRTCQLTAQQDMEVVTG